MTDRTNLDVAADAIRLASDDFGPFGKDVQARAALDAIHPALADLTPDDVAAIFTFYVGSTAVAADVGSGPSFDHLRHVREVLNRDLAR